MHLLPAAQITDCDVTRKSTDDDVEVCADTSSVAAISRKTNAQPNGQKPRIYTSTPKQKFETQQKLKQSNDAIGFRNLAKATKSHYIYVGGAASVKGQGLTFDVRLKALLVVFGIVIIGYRIVSLAMPFISENSVEQFSSYVQAQLNTAMDWSKEHQLSSKLSPLLCGFLVASFFYGMVYMDSYEPGVNPPTPFSTRSKQRNRQMNTLQLSYLGAIASGILVTLLMYMEF